MTTSQTLELSAAPAPTTLIRPPESSNASPEVIALAASAGLILDPWQALALDAMLGETEDGNWAATQAGLIVARQNGKGSIIEVRELAGLLLFGETIIHTAHLTRTSSDAFERLVRLMDTPDIMRHVLQVRRANGEQAVKMRSGAECKFIARTPSSGRGLHADLLIYDEAFLIPQPHLASLQATLSARGPGEMEGVAWFTSSPPIYEYLEGSQAIRGLRRTALSDRPGPTAWVEYGCELGCDLDDEDNWRRANPSPRISVGAIRNERAIMSDESFSVERLGVWLPEPSDPSASVFTADAWASCLELDARNDGPVTFGLEVTPDRDSAEIVVVGTWDGRPFAEMADPSERLGTGWVVDRLIELTTNHDYTAVAIDARSAAGSFIAPLEEAGVRVEVYNTRNIINAAGRLFDAVNAADIAKRLAHRGDPRLGSAVLAANRRVIGDAWAFGRRSSSSSIIAVVALSLALLAHETPVEVEAPPRPVFAW